MNVVVAWLVLSALVAGMLIIPTRVYWLALGMCVLWPLALLFALLMAL